MNKLMALRAKGEKEIINDVELDIKGMTFPEITEFAELADAKKTKEALDFLLYVTLRKAMPTKEKDPEDGLTDEELREEIKLMDGVQAMKIVKAVQDKSGIGGDEEKKDVADENPPEKK